MRKSLLRRSRGSLVGFFGLLLGPNANIMAQLNFELNLPVNIDYWPLLSGTLFD